MTAVQIGHGVEPRHALDVDAGLQRLAQALPRARVPGDDLPADEQHRGVVGEEAPVVLQQPQAMPGELAVGREDVHDVDVAGGDRAIRERVLHDAHPGQRQAVVPAEAGPAVVALEEPGAEGRGQLPVAGEVADGPEPEAVGRVGADGERVRVGEAQGAPMVRPSGSSRRADRVPVSSDGSFSVTRASVPAYSG